MFKYYDVSERITKERLPMEITEVLYAKSLLDVVDFISTELKTQLESEGRFKGVMLFYNERIKGTLSKIIGEVSDSDVDFFGRTLYLLRVILRREHTRLVRKGLSSADSTICIIRKIIKIVRDFSITGMEELIIVEEILDKVWGNIRRNSKKDSLFSFSNLIRNCISERYVGKYSMDSFEIEEKERKLQVLEGDGTRLCIDGENKIGEVTL